ncbi:MAG: sulfatase-like hydrolase/transferase, partial [Proteobacteria bacterium]|nr:sulfatase-like hydrolase/transferase [Pseudomonadota bacterium]
QRRWQLTPRDARAWDDVKPAKQTELDFRMAIYAAQIDRMDQGIGRIVQALKRRGLFDNTLILFLADNGGCAEGGEFGGGPANFLGTKQGYMLSYGRGWANASNTPFRRYKHWVHEGGIATPLIAHWPAGIKRRNEFERQPGHLIDIMATCVELAGAAYPTRRGQSDIQPMEGTSLVPAFGGGKLARGTPLFFEHEGNRAVRDGKWKLVARGATGPWELYDMAADRSELHNLAADYPEVAKRLNQKWEAWAARANAVPWPWAGKHRGENIKPKARKKRKPGAKRNKKAA